MGSGAALSDPKSFATSPCFKGTAELSSCRMDELEQMSCLLCWNQICREEKALGEDTLKFKSFRTVRRKRNHASNIPTQGVFHDWPQNPLEKTLGTRKTQMESNKQFHLVASRQMAAILKPANVSPREKTRRTLSSTSS